MKTPKIVLVSEWDGWCGACAAERPLVLTRTGRQRLRTWLTGAADDSVLLVLTCRLCGTGVEVPLEQDDPPVVATWAELAVPVAAPVPVTAEAPLAEPAPSAGPTSELTTARPGVAHALGAFLAARTAEAAVPAIVPAPVAVAAPLVAPAVPLQRTPATGGLAELQLLADGIDLLSTGRA